MDIYTQWKDLREVEEQFNNHEARIRQLASAWLLATLGAIAFILQGDPKSDWLISPPEMLVSLVSIMGMIGIAILWIQDQLVFHRLLNSAVLMGLKLEFDHKQLPPLRTLYMIYSDNKGMAHLARLYYLVPIIALAVIALFASLFWMFEHPFFALLLNALAAYIPWKINDKGKTLEQFDKRAEGFDPAFVTWLASGNFQQQLKDYEQYKSSGEGMSTESLPNSK